MQHPPNAASSNQLSKLISNELSTMFDMHIGDMFTLEGIRSGAFSKICYKIG
jgi:hypothetical protein